MIDITAKPPYHISSMAMILFGLSVLADSGKTDDITFTDVKKHVKAGDLIEYLTKKGGGVFASGHLEGPSQKGFRAWYVEQIKGLTIEGRERHCYGIENRGICLLISYTAEIIQRGKKLTLQFPQMAPGSKRPS
jgi:hypothetical protein